MKSIIVTFSDSYNFGASLQTYALKEAVKKFDENVNVLNIKKNSHREVRYFGGIKGLLCNPIIFINKKKLNQGNLKFENFTEEYLDLTCENYNTYQKLLDTPPQADLFISGSDQVFNPNTASPVFFLNFVNKDYSRMVSYAASFGRNVIPADNKEKIKSYLERFDSISIREKQGVKLIKETYGINAECHIDPVFLITRDNWRKLERKPQNVDGKYVLLYLLYRPHNINKEIKKIRRLTGLPVYAIDREIHRLILADKVLVECGPNEFLWLIDHAEMIYTTSFHGLAFSLIFNKKVKAINNKYSPDRIRNLLEVLEYNSCLEQPLEKIWNANVDTCYCEKIEKERIRALNYLQEIFDESN